MALVNTVQDVLLGKLVTSEGPLTLETQSLSIQVEKVHIKSISEHKSTLGKCSFGPPSPESLGLEEGNVYINNKLRRAYDIYFLIDIMFISFFRRKRFYRVLLWSNKICVKKVFFSKKIYTPRKSLIEFQISVSKCRK